MLSCNFDFLKNLTDFRPIILHLVKKSKSSFMERLPFKYLFLVKPYLSFIIIHIQVCKHSWYTRPPKRRLVGSIMFRSSRPKVFCKKGVLRK